MKKLLFIACAILCFNCGTDNGSSNEPETPTPTDGSPTSSLEFNVVNRNAQDYIFNGNGFTDAADPVLTLKRGETYIFNINAAGHPFYIKREQSAGAVNAYNAGVTNNGTEVGTVTFTVPMDAPDILYYNCQFHSIMTNQITITD